MPATSVADWVVRRLEQVKHLPRLLVVDKLGLMGLECGAIREFGRTHGFSVFVAATNLAFRELYERTIAASEDQKLLVVDRCPYRRGGAPPIFYPDLVASVDPEGRVGVSLRQYLQEVTGDPGWPSGVDSPEYASLIAHKVGAVLTAHENLRAADPTRFTDTDFRKIVSFAALGVPEAAFRNPTAQDYWRMGLLAHEALRDLQSLMPEVVEPIKEQIARAPAPFCWFAKHDASLVLRAFYLGVVLSQHMERWDLLLANVDPALRPFTKVDPAIMCSSAPDLIRLDVRQAEADLESAESSLGLKELDMLLFDEMHLQTASQQAEVIEKERYSTLLRTLALATALGRMLKGARLEEADLRIRRQLTEGAGKSFVEQRSSTAWTQLAGAFGLAADAIGIVETLEGGLKKLAGIDVAALGWEAFWSLWNGQKVNRLEYVLSALERLVNSGDLLPRPRSELPAQIGDALVDAVAGVRALSDRAAKGLRQLNAKFEGVIAAHYAEWVANPGKVVLTSRFMESCLKRHWDPTTEKAVVFVFDGMRYDIWDQLLRPGLLDRMERVEEYQASALLPSETHISRKAICAGTFPDQFDSRAGEDALLKQGLNQHFGYTGNVEVVRPESLGVGETVRYRAGNLDVYIFELCDKELHKIDSHRATDGRLIPGRPLAFVYEQLIKSVIDTEVMAAVRSLAPKTKVFVVADHGFAIIDGERVRLDNTWLNEVDDCKYRDAMLRSSLKDVGAPKKMTEKVIEFPVGALRLPTTGSGIDRITRASWQKTYSSVIFPKTGFVLERPKAKFRPDAYSHGGISIQELFVPMVVLRIRDRDEGLLVLDEISGPSEVFEGQDAEFRVRVARTDRGRKLPGDIRAQLVASYTNEPGHDDIRKQTVYVTEKGTEVCFAVRCTSTDLSDDQRKIGRVKRTLIVTLSYTDGRESVHKSRARQFEEQLDVDRVARRVPPSLGKVLGMAPRGSR